MTEEITIYNKTDIKITNLRAIFNEKTYSVSNITSVETKKISPSSCLPFSILFFGIIFFVIGISDIKHNMAFIIGGLVGLGLFYIINKTSKPSWAVSISTASGEIKAYTSLEQETIQEIVDALNTAIIQKG